MRPLIFIIVATYNQAGIVEEAVRSVFAQDYSPFEIILSDDCSTEHTFDILQRMKDHYDGPHEVTLNRNPTNLGIGRHWDMISR